MSNLTLNQTTWPEVADILAFITVIIIFYLMWWVLCYITVESVLHYLIQIQKLKFRNRNLDVKMWVEHQQLL